MKKIAFFILIVLVALLLGPSQKIHTIRDFVLDESVSDRIFELSSPVIGLEALTGYELRYITKDGSQAPISIYYEYIDTPYIQAKISSEHQVLTRILMISPEKIAALYEPMNYIPTNCLIDHCWPDLDEVYLQQKSDSKGWNTTEQYYREITDTDAWLRDNVERWIPVTEVTTYLDASKQQMISRDYYNLHIGLIGSIKYSTKGTTMQVLEAIRQGIDHTQDQNEE